MVRRLASLADTLLRDERAQAAVEYALVVSVTVALLLGVSSMVLDGLATYYTSIARVICLPIP